jgi:uncharacterized protein YbjT (DUF2867 family)
VTSTVHERDVAAVAVRALVDPRHVGRSYLLTGSQSLSQYDKVRLLGEAIGKELPGRPPTTSRRCWDGPPFTFAQWATERAATFRN